MVTCYLCPSARSPAIFWLCVAVLKPWERPEGRGLQLQSHLQDEGRGHSCSQVLPSGSPREPTEQHSGLALAPSSPRRTAPEAGLGPVTALLAPSRPTHLAWCWEARGPPAFPLSLVLVLASVPPTTRPAPSPQSLDPRACLLPSGLWVLGGRLCPWSAVCLAGVHRPGHGPRGWLHWLTTSQLFTYLFLLLPADARSAHS